MRLDRIAFAHACYQGNLWRRIFWAKVAHAQSRFQYTLCETHKKRERRMQCQRQLHALLIDACFAPTDPGETAN